MIKVACIRASDFTEIFAKADDGAEWARDFCHAFMHWSNRAEEKTPYCFSCEKVIKKGCLGGLAVASIEGSDGAVGAFCTSCTSKGHNALVKIYADRLSECIMIEPVEMN